MADLAKNVSNVKVGSQKFLARLEDPSDISLQQSEQMRQKWGSISDRLLATYPDSVLAKQLRDFAEDGGIGKLRQLLLDHLAEHSLKQLYEDTKKTAEKLRQEQGKLEQILLRLGIITRESPASAQLRDAIEEIYRTYNRFKDNLGKEPLKDKRGGLLSDVIKDEVIYRILEWSEWNLLFSRSDNGIIKLPPPVAKNNKRSLFDDSKFSFASDDKIPTKSDDFYHTYSKTVEELQNFARDRIKEAISNLLNQLSEKLSIPIQYLDENLKEELTADIQKEFNDDKKARRYFIVWRSYTPEKWQEIIQENTFEGDENIDIETKFPLARASTDNNHDGGQFFDWSKEYQQKHKQTTRNHILLVQRIRDEITASASLHIIEYVGEVNKKVDNEILDILNLLIPELDSLRRDEVLLRYIMGEKDRSNEDDRVSEILSQIAVLSP